jgi:hypothetical protein
VVCEIDKGSSTGGACSVTAWVTACKDSLSRWQSANHPTVGRIDPLDNPLSLRVCGPPGVPAEPPAPRPARAGVDSALRHVKKGEVCTGYIQQGFLNRGVLLGVGHPRD